MAKTPETPKAPVTPVVSTPVVNPEASVPVVNPEVAKVAEVVTPVVNTPVVTPEVSQPVATPVVPEVKKEDAGYSGAGLTTSKNMMETNSKPAPQTPVKPVAPVVADSKPNYNEGKKKYIATVSDKNYIAKKWIIFKKGDTLFLTANEAELMSKKIKKAE